MYRLSFWILSSLLAINVPFLSWAVPTIIEGKDLLTGSNLDRKLELSRKATVVAFLSVHCPSSASHESVLKELAKEFGSSGFDFLAVHSNVDEEMAMAREHFMQAGKMPPVRMSTAMGCFIQRK